MLKRPRKEESRKAMLEAWRKYHSPGTPVDEIEPDEIPDPPPAFIRAWEWGIDWYRSQKKHHC